MVKGYKYGRYNNFYVGARARTEIIAGCGIHNDEHKTTQHDGIHSFYCAQGSYLKYVEKHFGNGAKDGTRILNPKTKVILEKDAICEMEMSQIGGVTSTIRDSENIKAGDISLAPYKSGSENGCAFCDFKNICKFEAGCFGTDWNEKDITTEKMEEELYGRHKMD